MDGLTRVYEKYKCFDPKLSSWATDQERRVLNRLAGEMWIAIKKEIEMGDDGK